MKRLFILIFSSILISGNAHAMEDVLFGVDDNAIKNNSESWLRAIDGGDKDLCELMLQQGADPDMVLTELGWTPLILAALHNMPEICELLIKAGANPNCIDAHGDIALLAAVCRFNQHIAELILNAMLNFRDKEQKKSIEALIVSLRRLKEKIPGVYGHNVRQLFCESFPAAIRMANKDKVRAEVDKLYDCEIKQYLLHKYFSCKSAEAMPLKDSVKEGDE